MYARSPLPETAMIPGTRNTKGTRLHGRWLVMARAVWVAVVVFTLSIFIASLPAYFAQLQTVCADVTCVYSYGQLTPGTAQALHNLGLSTGPDTYIGDTRGKIAILLEARRWLHVSYLLPQMLPLDSRKDEAKL